MDCYRYSGCSRNIGVIKEILETDTGENKESGTAQRHHEESEAPKLEDVAEAHQLREAKEDRAVGSGCEILHVWSSGAGTSPYINDHHSWKRLETII